MIKQNISIQWIPNTRFTPNRVPTTCSREWIIRDHCRPFESYEPTQPNYDRRAARSGFTQEDIGIYPKI